MQYTPAKVTIELNEYNELLLLKNVDKDDMVFICKEVICAFLSAHLDPNKALDQMKARGVSLTVQHTGRGVYEPEHIVIGKIERITA